jgi:O-antigen/teichoic acid export membrane protein
MSSSVISLISSILTSIFVARFLTVYEMGIYALIMLWPSIIELAVRLGVPRYILRYVSHHMGSGEVKLGRAAFARGVYTQMMLLTPIILITAVYPKDIFSILYGKTVDGLLIQLTIAIFITWILRTDFYALLEANMDMLGSSISRILYFIPRAVLAITLTYLGYGVLGALAGDILGGIISTISGVILSAHQKLIGLISPEEYRDGLRDMFSFSMPIYIVTILEKGMRNYILWLLGFLYIEDVVGNYYVTLRFSNLIQVITIPISRIIVPTLTRVNKERLGRAIYYVYRYAAIVIVPIPIFAIVLSRDMIYGLFGSKYKLAPELLAIFSFIYILTIFGYYIIPPMLVSVGQTRKILYGLSIRFIVVLFLGPILIWNYGAVGAVSALLISAVAGTIGLLYIIRDVIPYPPIGDNLKTLVSAVVPGIIIYFIWLNFRFDRSIYNLAFFFIIYIILYLVLLGFTGSINERELEVIYDSMSKVAVLGGLIKPLIQLERKIIDISNKLRGK